MHRAPWLFVVFAIIGTIGCRGSHIPEVRTIDTRAREDRDTSGLHVGAYSFSLTLDSDRAEGEAVVRYTMTVDGLVTVLAPDLLELRSTQGACRKQIDRTRVTSLSYIQVDCAGVRMGVRQVGGKLVDGTVTVQVGKAKGVTRICITYETLPEGGRGRCIKYETRPLIKSEWTTRSVALDPLE